MPIKLENGGIAVRDLEAAKQLAGTAAFAGVNIRDTGTAAPQSFVRRFEVPYKSFYSPDSDILLDFPRPLGPWAPAPSPPRWCWTAGVA